MHANQTRALTNIIHNAKTCITRLTVEHDAFDRGVGENLGDLEIDEAVRHENQAARRDHWIVSTGMSARAEKQTPRGEPRAYTVTNGISISIIYQYFSCPHMCARNTFGHVVVVDVDGILVTIVL